MIFHKQLKLEDKNPCHDMQVAVRGQRPWRPDMVRTDAFDADSGKAPGICFPNPARANVAQVHKDRKYSP